MLFVLACCAALFLFTEAMDALATYEDVKLQRQAITAATTVRVTNDIANGGNRSLPPLEIAVPTATTTQ